MGKASVSRRAKEHHVRAEGPHRRHSRQLPLSFGPARRRQVRPDPAAEPGPAACHRRGRDHRAAAHRRRLGVAVPRAGPGGAFLTMRVADAVGRGLARFIAARHEGGATVMADAWARTTGMAGMVTVHQGPGLTNAMTGIAEAAKSRTPLLVLAAEAPEARSNFH